MKTRVILKYFVNDSGTCRNKPKQSETSHNNPERPGTTKKQLQTCGILLQSSVSKKIITSEKLKNRNVDSNLTLKF